MSYREMIKRFIDEMGLTLSDYDPVQVTNTLLASREEGGEAAESLHALYEEWERHQSTSRAQLARISGDCATCAS